MLYNAGGATKQQIVNQLGLCLPTVTNNINGLLEQGLVQEAGYRESTGGRRAKTYCIVSDVHIAIGLDITHATCAEFSKYIPYPTVLFKDANAADCA